MTATLQVAVAAGRPGAARPTEGSPANNASVVLLVEVRGRRLLLDR